MTKAITERVAGFAGCEKAAVAELSSPFSKAGEFDPIVKIAHWLTLFLTIAVFSIGSFGG